MPGLRRAPILLLALTVACGSRAEAPTATSTTTPAPTSSVASTATPSPSPSAPPSPTAKPRPYTSLALAYRVDLPDPWRRSSCQSTAQAADDAVDTFTNASVDEESGSDTGPAQDVVVLRTEINRAGLTALAWL